MASSPEITLLKHAVPVHLSEVQVSNIGSESMYDHMEIVLRCTVTCDCYQMAQKVLMAAQESGDLLLSAIEGPPKSLLKPAVKVGVPPEVASFKENPLANSW